MTGDPAAAEREYVIVGGTYDGWFCGWLWKPQPGELLERFGVTDHAGPITAVAACPSWLASGAEDENVRLYITPVFKGFGILGQHRDTISCLRFCRSTFLLVGDRKGTVSCNAHKGKGFTEVAAMQVHKGAVNDVDAKEQEPTMVLSVGADRLMKLTNLSSQRTVDSRKFADVPILCRYGVNCHTYCIGFEKRVAFYSAKERQEAPVGEYHSKEVIHCLAYVDEARIAIGCDNKEVRVLTVFGTLLCSMAQHLNRVKGVAVAYNGDKTYTVVSVDSDGKLIVSKLAASASQTQTKRPLEGTAEEVPTKRAAVVWQRDLKGEFVPYPSDLCESIEAAYQAKAPSFELPNTPSARFVLDFSTMTQTNHSARPKRARAIQRCAAPLMKCKPQPMKEPAKQWRLDVCRSRKSHLRFTCLALTRYKVMPERAKPPLNLEDNVADS